MTEVKVCETHARAEIFSRSEELTLPGALTRTYRCRFCPEPAEHIFRVNARRLHGMIVARTAEIRREETALLRGHVRECKQWDVYTGVDHWRWDFAFTDPASGRVRQYSVIGTSVPSFNDEQFAEQVRAPSIACLARSLHQQCGIRKALANEHSLRLPRSMLARYV